MQQATPDRLHALPIYAPYGVDVKVVISAVDSNRNLAFFSNFGVPIIFSGVGVGNLVRLTPPGTFLNGDGTSFAAPSCCAIALRSSAISASQVQLVVDSIDHGTQHPSMWWRISGVQQLRIRLA